MTNTNPKTSIRYGYIRADSLRYDVLDELQFGSQARDVHWEEALYDLRSDFASILRDWHLDEAFVARFANDCVDEVSDEIGNHWYDDEPIHEGELEGVKYRTSWLGGALNVWIFESPFTDVFQECSPCVPGAGNLNCPDKEGVLTYDVPLAWRADDAQS